MQRKTKISQSLLDSLHQSNQVFQRKIDEVDYDRKVIEVSNKLSQIESSNSQKESITYNNPQLVGGSLYSSPNQLFLSPGRNVYENSPVYNSQKQQYVTSNQVHQGYTPSRNIYQSPREVLSNDYTPIQQRNTPKKQNYSQQRNIQQQTSTRDNLNFMLNELSANVRRNIAEQVTQSPVHNLSPNQRTEAIRQNFVNYNSYKQTMRMVQNSPNVERSRAIDPSRYDPRHLESDPTLVSISNMQSKRSPLMNSRVYETSPQSQHEYLNNQAQIRKINSPSADENPLSNQEHNNLVDLYANWKNAETVRTNSLGLITIPQTAVEDQQITDLIMESRVMLPEHLPVLPTSVIHQSTIGSKVKFDTQRSLFKRSERGINRVRMPIGFKV